MPKKSKTAGRAELAASVSDAEPIKPRQWTDAELDQYDPDNPYPPYTPGASADNTIASYEYEIAALKRKMARAEAALRPFAELGREALATLSEHAKPEYVWYQLNDAKITNGDLQAAVDALAGD